jgi:hypothetical protein
MKSVLFSLKIVLNIFVSAILSIQFGEKLTMALVGAIEVLTNNKESWVLWLAENILFLLIAYVMFASMIGLIIERARFKEHILVVLGIPVIVFIVVATVSRLFFV